MRMANIATSLSGHTQRRNDSFVFLNQMLSQFGGGTTRTNLTWATISWVGHYVTTTTRGLFGRSVVRDSFIDFASTLKLCTSTWAHLMPAPNWNRCPRMQKLHWTKIALWLELKHVLHSKQSRCNPMTLSVPRPRSTTFLLPSPHYLYRHQQAFPTLYPSQPPYRLSLALRWEGVTPTTVPIKPTVLAPWRLQVLVHLVLAAFLPCMITLPPPSVIHQTIHHLTLRQCHLQPDRLSYQDDHFPTMSSLQLFLHSPLPYPQLPLSHPLINELGHFTIIFLLNVCILNSTCPFVMELWQWEY